MKLDVDIKKLLSAVDVPADWVGLREVYEAHTHLLFLFLAFLIR